MLGNIFAGELDGSHVFVKDGVPIPTWQARNCVFTENLATSVLSDSLLVVHDTVGSGQDEVTEVTGRKEVVAPLVHVLEGDVETGRDDTSLVQAADEVDDDLAVSMIIDNFELANVT